MQILITGGGGFLGRAIVEQLLARGDAVRSVARGDYPELRALGVDTHRGDLADPEVARRAVEGCDAVIHVAAKAGVWGDPDDYRRANVVATQNIVDACRAHGVGRLVYTSSPSVTFDGGDQEGVGNDVAYPESYLAHYPRTKAEGERLALAADGEALRVTALRPHLIYGPGDPHLIPRIVERARAGKLPIVGDGENVVDLTYVDNAAAAHVQALDALEQPNGPAGNAYFVSDDAPVKIWSWLNRLLERLDLPPVTKKVSPKLAYAGGSVMEGMWRALPLRGEPRMTRFVALQLSTSHWYDMGPAKRDFGYAPPVDPEEGFERLVTWLQEEEEEGGVSGHHA